MTQLQINLTESSIEVSRMYRDDATDAERDYLNITYEILKLILEKVAQDMNIPLHIYGEDDNEAGK